MRRVCLLAALAAAGGAYVAYTLGHPVYATLGVALAVLCVWAAAKVRGARDAYWMPCPVCRGGRVRGCDTCDGDGVVPAWLTDPDVVGEETAASWRTR